MAREKKRVHKSTNDLREARDYPKAAAGIRDLNSAGHTGCPQGSAWRNKQGNNGDRNGFSSRPSEIETLGQR